MFINGEKLVVTTETQKRIIARTKTMARFRDVHLSFHGHADLNIYSRKMREQGVEGHENIRLHTLFGFMVASLGFSGYGRFWTRQEKFKGQEFDLAQLTGTMTYVAQLHERSKEPKRQWKERVSSDPEAQLGITNLFYFAKDGHPWYPEDLSDEGIAHVARQRVQREQPIVEPNEDLYTKLALIDHSNEQADKLTSAEFETRIFPQYAEALKGYLDPEALLAESRR